MDEAPLWRCRSCGREFANRNQTHSCGRYDLARHLDHATPELRATFDGLLEIVRAIGPVKLVPTKTRVGFQVRMIFAAVQFRRDHLHAHVVLARTLEHPRFVKIERLSPRNQVHHFELRSVDDLNEDVRAWLREAYAVGQQKHLVRK